MGRQSPDTFHLLIRIHWCNRSHRRIPRLRVTSFVCPESQDVAGLHSQWCLAEMSDTYIVSKNDPLLVTGSSGFIGAKVVELLLEYGFTNIRCFVRPSSRMERLNNVLTQFAPSQSIEIVTGDLLSRDSCAEAAKGVSIIYHLAAGFDKSFAAAFMNSALATRNLLEAFQQFGKPKRFVNVSSFAVTRTSS